MISTSAADTGMFPVTRSAAVRWSVPDLLSMFSDLVRFETQLWNALDNRLRVELEIPLGRFETLQVLGRRGSCRVNDIADDLCITWSGTSKIVDRLEASGLCMRRPNPQDGRSSLIELT
jgi:DNA-binding MarR family transcriptional regulator